MKRTKIETFTYVKRNVVLGYGCIIFDGKSRKVVLSQSEDGYFESEKEAIEAGKALLN